MRPLGGPQNALAKSGGPKRQNSEKTPQKLVLGSISHPIFEYTRDKCFYALHMAPGTSGSNQLACAQLSSEIWTQEPISEVFFKDFLKGNKGNAPKIVLRGIFGAKTPQKMVLGSISHPIFEYTRDKCFYALHIAPGTSGSNQLACAQISSEI